MRTAENCLEIRPEMGVGTSFSFQVAYELNNIMELSNSLLTKLNSSYHFFRSEEGQTLETSAPETLYDGQFTSLTQSHVSG